MGKADTEQKKQAWHDVVRIELERTPELDLNKVAWHGFVDKRDNPWRGYTLQGTHWLRFVKKSTKVPAAGLMFVGEWSCPTDQQPSCKVANQRYLDDPHGRANKPGHCWDAEARRWLYPMASHYYAPYHGRRIRTEQGKACPTKIDDKYYMDHLYRAAWKKPEE